MDGPSPPTTAVSSTAAKNTIAGSGSATSHSRSMAAMTGAPATARRRSRSGAERPSRGGRCTGARAPRRRFLAPRRRAPRRRRSADHVVDRRARPEGAATRSGAACRGPSRSRSLARVAHELVRDVAARDRHGLAAELLGEPQHAGDAVNGFPAALRSVQCSSESGSMNRQRVGRGHYVVVKARTLPSRGIAGGLRVGLDSVERSATLSGKSRTGAEISAHNPSGLLPLAPSCR